MNIKEAVLKRRSIRKFNDKKISDEIIKDILEAAMAAPSACNLQPWEFFVIKNKDMQEEIRSKASRFTNYNSSLIIVVAGNEKKSLPGRLKDFWQQDCSAAIENMLLMATYHNVGTCWCGLYPNIESVEKVREILKQEKHIVPLALIHLGYYDENVEPRSQYDEAKVHIID